jgi:biopolymer transport protein ExbD
MSLYRPRKRKVEINIVPLIDLMTVLIFFFLMTMRFDEMQALAITPPTAESAGRDFSKGAGETVVAVTKAGNFYLNGQKVEKEALLRHFAETGKKYPGTHILVVADEQTLTKNTFYIIDQAAKVGLVPRVITKPARR